MKFALCIITGLIMIFPIHKLGAQNLKPVAGDAKLHLVADRYSFTEGPAADKSGNVYFTDQPNNVILKWDAATDSVTEYMKPAGRANGLYVDGDGNLLAAADENNELWRIGPHKNVSVLIGAYEGKKLNGPNDLWLDDHGGIYFTDPYYQRSWWEHTTPPQPEKRVYYLASGAEKPVVVAENLQQPNGIIGTPNGNTLYVADIQADKTYKYDIGPNGKLHGKRLFTSMGSDGMTIDNQGNVYLTGNGVTVFDSTGKKILHIPVPGKWTGNVTFGGKDYDILFITASRAVYTLKMNVHGIRW